MIEVVYVPVEANSGQYMDYLENKLNNGYNVVRADSCNNAIMYIIEKKDNKLSEKETIQIEKDRSLEFNINNSVKVKLSKKGAEVKNIINSGTNKFFEDRGIKGIKKLKEDYVEGDIYEAQLWALMSEFGPCLLTGMDSPFLNCEIYFNDKELKDVEDLK